MNKKYCNISVVIPAYNEAKNIGSLLEALINQTQSPKEVIIVDNNSTDDTVEQIIKFKNKFKKINVDLIVLTNPVTGVAETRNIGFKKASQPIIASMDADSFPNTDWIEKINTFFINNPDSLGVTGKIIMYDAPFIPRMLTKYGWYQFYYACVRFFCGFQILSTANSGIKKTAFEKVNGFDMDRDDTNKLDDVDFSSRINLIGKTNFDSRILCYSSFRRYSTFRKAIYSVSKRAGELSKIAKKYKLLLKKTTQNKPSPNN